jgi:phospholipid/cholesterol/gamma-HCH transport system substrate-binding protein
VKLSKEFKIGVVVVCAIAALIWGINFLKGTNLFSRKYHLYAVYPRIDNLKPSDALQINGYKVGQINHISILQRDDRNFILVEFLLTEDVDIPKKSIARAVSNDILGNKAVELIFSKEKELVEDGDTLIAETEQGLKESFNKQIAPLQAKAESLLASVDSVMSVVNLMLNARTRENIDKSFESVRKAILSIEQTAYSIHEMVDPKLSSILTNINNITANLNKSEQKINNILSNFSSISDSLAKAELRGAVDNAAKSMHELNTLLARINEGQGTLGKLARNDSLYNNLNKSAEHLDRLLKDLNENPKRYVHFSIFGKKNVKP